MTDCMHSAIAPNMNHCIKCGAWLGDGPENTRAARGGEVAIKGDSSFTATLEEPASLEQRAHDLFWALMQAPYADTTIGNIVCAETTPQRLESAWIPLLTAALANQQGVGGWQPIATAPRDGTRVLTAFHGVAITVNSFTNHDGVAPGYRIGRDKTWWSSPPHQQPTHWLPIPTPPTQPAGDVGREG